MHPRVLPAGEIGPGHIFMLLYTVALVTDLDDVLLQPVTWVILGLSVWVVLSLSRVSFLVLLATTTLYFVLEELPDTENHTNLIVITNVSIILCLICSYSRKRRGSEEAFYDIAQPIVRLLAIVALATAGFHKFNRDFINPEVSCIRRFAGDMGRVFTGDNTVIGLPPIFFLGLMLGVVAVLLWRQRPDFCWPSIDSVAISTPIAAILIGMALLSTVGGDPRTYDSVDFVVFFLAVAVLCWQLIEAPLLLVPRFQWVAICFSLLVHVLLAVYRIVDFQAIIVALLVAFVPSHIWHAWNRNAIARIGPLGVHRARLYYLISLAFVFILTAQAVGVTALSLPRPLTLWGLAWTAGLLVVLWPIISDLFSPQRAWKWQGVPVLKGSAPSWLYAMPVLLLLFGLTSHLGLRTAGNLSMYSNLRTEAGHNNHLLLGGNQMKWWGYQEDVVRIVDIGDDVPVPSFKGRWSSLDGNLLPVVEFRKYLHWWREQGGSVPMTIEYKGVVKDYPNIPLNPEWRVDEWDWEMRLSDFRVIQGDTGPNSCVW